MKILIVDDEVLVRIGLKTVFENSGEKYEVYEASDGAEAYDKFKKINPDLIFVDINMPKMDGLKFIEAAKKENKRAKFMVLTCHSDFNLMREAIKIGVNDYIIKTSINNNELIEIAKKIELDILKMSNNNEGINAASSTNIDISKEFKNMISGDNFDEHKVVSYVKQKIANKLFDVLVLAQKHTLKGNAINKDYHIVDSVVSNLINELVIEYGNGFVIQINEEKYIIFQTFNVPKNLENRKKIIEEFSQRLILSLKNYFNSNFSIGICINSSLETIEDSIREADSAIKYNFFDNKSSYYFYNKETTDFLPDLNFDTLKNKINEKLNELKYSDATELINEYVARIIEIPTCKVEKVIDVFFKIFYGIVQHVDQYYSEISNEIVGTKIDYTTFLEANNIFEIADIINRVLIQLSKISFNDKDFYYNGIICKAKGYIEQHLGEKISLQDVSHYVGLSTSHFCKLFKDIEGVNFVNYCTKLKVEKVKIYIIKGDKVFVAAQKVGYDNYSYFSRLFKKVTGINPEEYKNSLQNMD